MSTPETLFETRWIRMLRLGHWDFVRRPQSENCVGILAVTPAREVILVEQFRIPLQRRVVEIPAGIVGDEESHEGASLAEIAARELLEETGYRAESMEPLIVTPTSAGLTSECIHLFRADGLIKEHEGGGVAGENIVVHHVPLDRLRDWLRDKERSGVLIDFKIHAALWLAGF